MPQAVYALNLFNISNIDEYLAYSKRSAREVAAHGGRVVALGKFREAAAGSIEPRSVLIIVEWASKDAFDSYCNDPRLADLHPHRVNGTRDYIWHLFDKLEDLRPLLKWRPMWRAPAGGPNMSGGPALPGFLSRKSAAAADMLFHRHHSPSSLPDIAEFALRD